MKRNFLFLTLAICTLAWSCDKSTTEDMRMEEWETTLAENCANAENMAKFLEEANMGVVKGGILWYEKNGKQWWGDDLDGAPSPSILIDANGTMRMYTSITPSWNTTRDSMWQVAEGDPTVFIVTDDFGTHQSRLIAYKEGEYFFEGYFPGFNDDNSSDPTWEWGFGDNCVIRLRIDTDPERRVRLEELYERTKAENEQK